MQTTVAESALLSWNTFQNGLEEWLFIENTLNQSIGYWFNHSGLEELDLSTKQFILCFTINIYWQNITNNFYLTDAWFSFYFLQEVGYVYNNFLKIKPLSMTQILL